MSTKKYTAVFPIKHNGKLYKKGDPLQMEPADAEYLVKKGVISLGKEEPVGPNSGMPEPQVGQPKPPEGAATQLTQDPGIPQKG